MIAQAEEDIPLADLTPRHGLSRAAPARAGHDRGLGSMPFPTRARPRPYPPAVRQHGPGRQTEWHVGRHVPRGHLGVPSRRVHGARVRSRHGQGHTTGTRQLRLQYHRVTGFAVP